MKRLIDSLLEQLEAYSMPDSVQVAIELVQDAMESGAFDCPVEHPASESPQQDGRYLVLIDGWGWDVKYWTLEKWQTHAMDKILFWRELPPEPEVTK